MNLSKEEINILELLIEDRLEEIYNGPEEILSYYKPEILKNLLQKLNHESNTQTI